MKITYMLDKSMGHRRNYTVFRSKGKPNPKYAAFRSKGKYQCSIPGTIGLTESSPKKKDYSSDFPHQKNNLTSNK